MDKDFGPALYGTLTVGALLAAEGAARETYLETVSAVLAAILLYGLTHAYAKYTAARLRAGRPLSWSGLRSAAERELPMLAGAAVPLVVVLLAWAGQVALSTALLAGTLTAGVVVFATEALAGLRARLRGRELAVQLALGAGLGCLLVALRVLLH
jgi:hypothetical protein